ncbi:hypothetical protein [Methanobacterium sp.]|uniref:hypothetical protein n=1 Tax=Methanobacterium sp. TaxID=2164 RepID=UPI003158D442
MNVPAVRNENQKVVPEGQFYEVAKNKKAPDAVKVQNEANTKKIRTKILEKIQTNDYAEAIVRAYAPNGTYVDDIVHHDFNTVMQLKALEYLSRQVQGKVIFFEKKKIQMFQDVTKPFTPDGSPILTPEGFLKLLTDMARFKNFSLRDACTKAQRRAQLKVLNQEWRDNEEIKAEKDEENQVTDMINDQKNKKPDTNSTSEDTDSVKQDDGSEIIPPKQTKKPNQPRILTKEEIAHLKNKNTNLSEILDTLDNANVEITKTSILKLLENKLGDKSLPDFDLEAFKQCKKDLKIN